MIDALFRRLLSVQGTACVLGLLLAAPTTVEAGDWLFRPSYHSRQDRAARRHPPRSRSAYRRPFVPAHPGFGIQGIHRFNRIVLQSGRSTDITIVREDWFHYRP